MPFLQVTLEVSAEECPPLEEALEELGALAITYADPGGKPVLEPGVGESPLWERVQLIALFDDETPERAVRNALVQAKPDLAEDALLVERLEDRSWERAWMDDFRPMRFGDRLWVCPSTEEPPDPAAVNLRLDPGLAFGTGTHPTTALCLRWLDRIDLSGQRVVDFGCGSGILAIAVLLLGAEHCWGVDNDPQALLASADNAERNGVRERLTLLAAADASLGPVDGVVANILAGVLIELAPMLQSLVRPGGWLALSGILTDQAPAVAQAYEPWFEIAEPQEQEGWVLLHGQKLPAL